MPPAVTAALNHVRRFHPEVTTVVFLGGQVWLYMSDYGDIPMFQSGIEDDILNEALDAAYETDGLPCIYRIDEPLP